MLKKNRQLGRYFYSTVISQITINLHDSSVNRYNRYHTRFFQIGSLFSETGKCLLSTVTTLWRVRVRLCYQPE